MHSGMFVLGPAVAAFEEAFARYVGVKEMMRLLEPFAKDAQAVRPDELRNLLILAGTERELKNLMDTIDMFDIDWMAGMSAGVFTLTNSDVKSVMAELDKIIGDKNTSPIAGILRIIPIDLWLNALLIAICLTAAVQADVIVDNLAPTEEVKSVRFVGDRAYRISTREQQNLEEDESVGGPTDHERE